MYLHLGQDIVVLYKDIVAIFDLDNCSYSRITQKYLEACEKSGAVVNVSQELPKSFIVCVEDGRQRIYVSQLSSQTLLGRVTRTIDNGQLIIDN